MDERMYGRDVMLLTVEGVPNAVQVCTLDIAVDADDLSRGWFARLCSHLLEYEMVLSADFVEDGTELRLCVSVYEETVDEDGNDDKDAGRRFLESVRAQVVEGANPQSDAELLPPAGWSAVDLWRRIGIAAPPNWKQPHEILEECAREFRAMRCVRSTEVVDEGGKVELVLEVAPDLDGEALLSSIRDVLRPAAPNEGS